MNLFVNITVRGLSAGAACAALAAPANADCNCRGNSAMPVARQVAWPRAPMPYDAPQAGSPVPLAPIPDSPPPSRSAPSLGLPAAPPPPPPLPVTPPASAGAPIPETVDSLASDAGLNRFGVSPPPGTLGRTYQRRSALVDDDKHSRYAAVDVYLPEEADVSARGLKPKWTGKVWRLETETPLLPGVPHIYAIKAERPTAAGEKSTDVRWVRLIMGRVVDLEF